MNQRVTYLTGIFLAALGVIIGAFGAHALKNTLQHTGRADTFELAVRYQFYHAFALVVTGILMNQFQSASMRYASLLFTFGIVLFSGILYVLAVTGITILGAITPFGGLCFIAGWALLLWAVYKK
jgi:uncharacterized membrane protein YgdD (TMEM256/DUF423 family)